MRKLLAVFWIGIWVGTVCHAALSQSQNIAVLEKELLEWINKERTARSLSPLRYSSDLRDVALGHSGDMASRLRLTHISTDGGSYQDRLVDARLYFIQIGENVAASETYVAEFIHQGFMESPEHRDNILNPDFDTVGIGIAYVKDKMYYITQDFFQSLEIRQADEAESLLQDEIEKIRGENGLPPLSCSKLANTFARRYSSKKALGQTQQNIANFFGETHIHFVVTPELAWTESIARKIASPVYESGGVGAWFGRLDDYPGGTYIVTLFLFPKSPYEGLEERDYVAIVLEALNARREKMGLVPLKLDTRSSKTASNISRQLSENESGSFVLPKSLMNREVLTYATEDLHVWPANLDPAVTNPALRRIGIGIDSKENEEVKKPTFWITLIL